MWRWVLCIITLGILSGPTNARPGVIPTTDPEATIALIESMTRYESDMIGFAGAPGSTFLEVEALVALGEPATEYLLRLTRSENPVARVAGIVGLEMQRTSKARSAIEALLDDQTKLETFEGCLLGQDTVATYARRALSRLAEEK